MVFSHSRRDVVERHSSRGGEFYVGVAEVLTDSVSDFLEEAEVRLVPVKGVQPVELQGGGVVVESFGVEFFVFAISYGIGAVPENFLFGGARVQRRGA